MFKHILCALILSLFNTASSATNQTITAWSYYPTEPFLTDAKSNAGLAQDLVQYLNQASTGKFKLRLQLLPRNRLDLALASGEKGIVLFAPSVIFGGMQHSRYFWSSALLHDNQGFVSRADKVFEYDAPQSLYGVHFLAMRGHHFPRLQKDIDEGKILVNRADSEGALLRMLIAKRADVITLPDSVVQYFIVQNPSLKKELYLSNKKLESFSRHLLFQQGMEEEFKNIEPIVLKINSDPKWIAILKKYGLEPSQQTP